MSVMAVSVAFTSMAQTADEIISKHVEAIGGKDKISQVKSLYMETAISIMGNDVPSTAYLLEGKGFKTEMEFNGSKIINAFTDKSGWMVNAMAGASTPQPMADPMYQAGKNALYAEGILPDYAAKGYKVELVGKEDSAYKLKATNGTNEAFYYIDPTTYYVTKTVMKGDMMGQPVDITTTFSDYKKTDFGLTIPFSSLTDMGAFSFPAKVTKVEVNKEIDPTIFEMPK